MTKPVNGEPWERMKGETAKAVEKFRLYRDLGPSRSLAKVGRSLGISTTRCEELSVKWNWVARAAAWDDEQDRIARQATLEAVERMHARHATLAVQLLNKVGMRLMGSPENNVTAIDANRFTAAEVARLAEVGVKIERVARGEAEARIDVAAVGEAAPEAIADRVMARLEQMAKRLAPPAPEAVATNGSGTPTVDVP